MAPAVLRAAVLCFSTLGAADGLRIRGDDEPEAEQMWAAALTAPNPAFTRCQPYCDPHLERIAMVRVPKPEVERGTALVRIAASSVNPQDWEGQQRNSPSESYPKLFGMDFAGTVVQAEAPCQFKPGDKVWGLFQETYAEYLVMPCPWMGLAPSNINLTEAATLPAVAITDVEALSIVNRHQHLAGKTVLIIGGAGGTGHVAIQLAKAMNASRVIATASTDHVEDCKSFGADEVLDYKTTNFWEALAPRSVDVVVNCAYVPDWDDDHSAEHSYQVLRDGGFFIAMNMGEMGSEEVRRSRPSINAVMFRISSTLTKWFDLLKDYVEKGQLRPKLGGIYPLSKLETALRAVRGHHPAGKFAIQIEGSGFPSP